MTIGDYPTKPVKSQMYSSVVSVMLALDSSRVIIKKQQHKGDSTTSLPIINILLNYEYISILLDLADYLHDIGVPSFQEFLYQETI